MAQHFETAPFDAALTTEQSQVFSKALFERFPWLREHAALVRRVGATQWSLVVHVPAPSGDDRTALDIWDDRGEDPSVGFGHWHTHEGVWRWELNGGTLFDLIADVVTERYVLCQQIGENPHDLDGLLDLDDENALLDELTNKYSTGPVRLRSWSGALDREWTIADLERGERPRRA